MSAKVLTLFMLCLFVLSGLFACKGTFEPPSEDKPEVSEKAEKPQKKMSHDPLGLKQDNLIVPQEYPLRAKNAIDSIRGDAVVIPTGDSIQFPTGAYDSYRIQLFTSKEYGPAFREMNVASEVFDQKVWFDYEVPYYKVRVGDFLIRMDAERYLPAAQEAGYKTAWVVKVNTSIKTMEDIYETELPIIDSLESEFTDPESVEDAGLDSLSNEHKDNEN